MIGFDKEAPWKDPIYYQPMAEANLMNLCRHGVLSEWTKREGSQRVEERYMPILYLVFFYDT